MTLNSPTVPEKGRLPESRYQRVTPRRGHNHQVRGRGKDKKQRKRREKMYVDRLQKTTVLIPLLSTDCYPDGNSPVNTMENSGK